MRQPFAFVILLAAGCTEEVNPERAAAPAPSPATVAGSLLSDPELRAELVGALIESGELQGPAGPVGPPGSAGDDGDDGQAGPQGVQGPPASPELAEAVAAHEGFLRGVTERLAQDPTFRAAVQGPAGAPGLDGEQGDAGPEGPEGREGPPGRLGSVCGATADTSGDAGGWGGVALACEAACEAAGARLCLAADVELALQRGDGPLMDLDGDRWWIGGAQAPSGGTCVGWSDESGDGAAWLRLGHLGSWPCRQALPMLCCRSTHPE